mmetsp:Transcript_12197/g.49009  ORF Transcript_12197/g.49009 Transcript_12197/m.49009 type:complete len:272 (-) Transcript_12197:612-1427(-)
MVEVRVQLGHLEQESAEGGLLKARPLARASLLRHGGGGVAGPEQKQALGHELGEDAEPVERIHLADLALLHRVVAPLGPVVVEVDEGAEFGQASDGRLSLHDEEVVVEPVVVVCEHREHVDSDVLESETDVFSRGAGGDRKAFLLHLLHCLLVQSKELHKERPLLLPPQQQLHVLVRPPHHCTLCNVALLVAAPIQHSFQRVDVRFGNRCVAVRPRQTHELLLVERARHYGRRSVEANQPVNKECQHLALERLSVRLKVCVRTWLPIALHA